MVTWCWTYVWRVEGRDILSSYEAVNGEPEHVSSTFIFIIIWLADHAYRESVFKGWQLLCVLLVTFPPSKNFQGSLHSYIHQATSQQEGRVDVMAKYCLRRLDNISRKGPRGKPPTLAEIETASVCASLVLRSYAS